MLEAYKKRGPPARASRGGIPAGQRHRSIVATKAAEDLAKSCGRRSTRTRRRARPVAMVHPGLERFFGALVRMSELRALREVDGEANLRGFEGDVNVELTGDDGWVWHCSLREGSMRWLRGGSMSPRSTVSLAPRTMLDLLAGSVSYSTASLTGRIRVRGEGHGGLMLAALVSRFRALDRASGWRGTLARAWRWHVLRAAETLR